MQFEWTKQPSDSPANPYYFRITRNGRTLSVSPPYMDGPWRMRLTSEHGGTLIKETFRLRHNERSDDSNLWESIDDLEKAKKTAFKIAEKYMTRQIAYWTDLLGTINEMQTA